MKRCTTLLLPLLFLTVSCGITVQYPGQRFEDGIYGSRVTREVHIYSPEEFEDMAALDLAARSYEDQKVTYNVYVLPSLMFDAFWGVTSFYRYYDPWFYDPWYYDPWYYRNWDYYYWNRHYYNHWYDPWYNPWYYHGYYNPWCYDPWYYGHHHGYWHDPYWHGGPVGPRPPRPGLSSDGRRYYGQRSFTQTSGQREVSASRGGNRTRSNYNRRCHWNSYL